MFLKGLWMDAIALWKSEARRVVAWSETLYGIYWAQGGSQGTASASDEINTQANALTPFYNMHNW